jgi:autophagy-related protein 9
MAYLSTFRFPSISNFHSISYTASFVLWAFIVYWFQKLIHHIFDIRNLLEMQSFYFHLLEVRDVDIQTISWQEIVHRLMKLRDSHPNIANPNRTRLNRLFSKERMDAHDIANRIMRIENYFIAMINRDILDLSLPVPFLNRRPVLTRALLWNIKLCIMNYVFDEQGQVRPAFVRDTHKRLLADGFADFHSIAYNV